MSLLEVKHLRKSFGDLLAVDGVSFRIDAGEILGLLGPNGAGKSTTMNMICGLLNPDAGEILLQGKQLRFKDRSARTSLGIVPQDLAIYPDLTGLENLQFFGRLYNINGAVLQERIAEALERVGLTNRADDKAGHYSGGMKRRLNFAVALLHHPSLLILDEPTVGIDPQSRAHLMRCIRDLNSEGVSAIYCSHYMEEVQELCERVVIVDHGKVIVCDAIENLLQQLTVEYCLRIKGEAEKITAALNGLATMRNSESGRYSDTPPDELLYLLNNQPTANGQQLSATLTNALQKIDEANGELLAVESTEPNLEKLFLQLTGNRLRD